MASKKSKLNFNFLKIAKISGIVFGGIFGLVILIMIVAPRPYYSEGFENFDEVKEYSKDLDEFMKMTGKNYITPDYSSYYQKKFVVTLSKRISNKIAWFFYLIYLKSRPNWSPGFFKDALEGVVKEREKKGMTGGKIINKVKAKESSKFVVFGNIQGAFHSFARCLYQLGKLNILDSNFKLKSLDYYIVFLGNLGDRSPYSLETQSLVLRLLQENPDNIIYIRSVHEYFKVWQRHTTKDELVFRLKDFSKEDIPLKSMFNKYLETLPIGFYAMLPKSEKEKNLGFVRFSAYRKLNEKIEKLDESLFSDFLKKDSPEPLAVFDLGKQKKSPDDAPGISMKAVLCDIYKRTEFQPTDGFRQLDDDRGAVAWTVLSTTIESYRVALKFFYDAFIVIEAGKKLEDWKATLYNQDVRNTTGFKQRSESFFYPKGGGKTEKSKDDKKSAKEAKKKVEGAKKAAAAKKPAEEAKKKAEEGKKAEAAKKPAEEAKKKAEEVKKAEAAKKPAEEAKKKAEEAKKAEAAKKPAEEAKKKAEESKKAEAAKNPAEEAKKKAEESKKAEAAKKPAEEAKKKAEESKKAEAAKKPAEEAKKKAEESKKAEAAKKPAEEAKKVEAAKKPAAG
jgi:hypothetical protein